MDKITLFLKHRRTLDILMVAISLIGVLTTSGHEKFFWSLATLLSIGLYYADIHPRVAGLIQRKLKRKGA